MILDCLKNCEQYVGVHKGFKEAFDFVKKAMQENLPAGHYEIDGKAIFAIIQEYTTKSEAGTPFEGHKKYIDIQCMVSGIEVFGVVDISKVKLFKDYDAEADYALYADSEKAGENVLEEGEFAVFFPWDMHKPCLAFQNKPSSVKKIVVKVCCEGERESEKN